MVIQCWLRSGRQLCCTASALSDDGRKLMRIDEAIRELQRSDPGSAQLSAFYPAIDCLCQAFLDGPVSVRERIIAATKTARIPLLGYAWYSAEEAVRTGAPDRVIRGLTALVIEGGTEDLRDSIMRLAVLFHSAVLLQMDAGRVFADAARCSNNSALADEIRLFPGRTPEARDLPAFMVRGRGNGREFRYEFEGASYQPKGRRLWPWQKRR